MAAVAVLPLVSLASGQQGSGSYVIFQLDNDIFTGSDNDYTNGARLAYLRPVSPGSLTRMQGVLKKMSGVDRGPLFGWLASMAESESTRYAYGIGLTQLMFTPDDPQATSSATGKRPYAGWLGAEVSLHVKDENALSSVVISIGVTGKYAKAQPTQNWVHRNISDSPIFQGWDSQVPAEVTVNLLFDRKRRLGWLARMTGEDSFQLDGYFEWGAYLGNGLTNAYVGTLVRAGLHLPVQYMTPRLQMGNYPHELFSSGSNGGSKWSLYGFAGVRGSAVLHNITLDGPLFKDFDTGTSSESLVGEFVLGAGFRYHGLTLAYSRTFRSREFSGQEYNHQFGSVLVSLGF
jgi:lipid A 3-O-deacylase